ncbi:hypothetical protein LTR95_000329 [Oleoguttula sp. CCFEE 5521]
MDRSNPYFVARKAERTKGSRTVRLQSSLALLRAPSVVNELSAETRYTYPEPPTQDGNGGYWTAHSYLAVSLAPREHAFGSPAPVTSSASILNNHADTGFSAEMTEQIVCSPGSHARDAQRDSRWPRRAAIQDHVHMSLAQDMAILGSQQLSQPFGTKFPRPASLHPPMLPPLSHSISSAPASITAGHRAGTAPIADVQSLVNAVHALARVDGRVPLRKHLLDPTEINPALYTIIRKHFSSSTGVMRYDSPVRMWCGDTALFPEEWWKYLTESVKRGT